MYPRYNSEKGQGTCIGLCFGHKWAWGQVLASWRFLKSVIGPACYFRIQLTLDQDGFELHRSTYMWIFSITIQSALCIPRFCVHRFNQPWMWRADSLHWSVPFLIGTWASAGFHFHRDPKTNPPWILRDGVCVSSPPVVHGVKLGFGDRLQRYHMFTSVTYLWVMKS